MTALFSLYPAPSSSLPSSSFGTPLSTLKHLSSFPRIKRTLQFKRTLFINSLLSAESDPSVPPQVQTFWKWLREEGVVSSKTPVRPGVVPEGLGLVTQRDIVKTEVVLEVPKRLWINPDTVSDSDIGSEEELSEIQGTQLLSTTLDVKEYVQSEFLKVKEEVILPNRQLFPFPISLDDFFWAFGIIRSRAFSRLRGQSLVLIPLVDLINHSHTVTTEDHAHEIPGPAGLFSWDLLFSLRSPAPVKAGEQVFIQYNLKKSNAEFVLDYGFVDLMPDRIKYMLTLKISESDPYFGDKLDIAESNDLGQTACFDIILDRPLPPTMFPYLRLIALGGSDAFLLESSFTDSVWRHLELPVSRTNEELLCQSVQHACKSALSGYQTTLEEDEKLKEEGNLDPRLEIAVGIRTAEKKVLQQIEMIFNERELGLDELEYYHDRRLKELGLVGEQGEIICQPK